MSMKIKRILGQALKILSVSMIIFAPTSSLSVGIEEMPESMKKLR
jgi:hypothetical protein